MRFDAQRPFLHKTIFVFCLPAFPAMANAVIYYLREGKIGPMTLLNGGAWDTITFFAPMALLLTGIMATILLSIFALSKRVTRASKWTAAVAVATAWICTACSSLVVDLK